jgi:radical SAM protein (TIGR01212 family)
LTNRSDKKSQRPFLYRSLASYLKEIFGKTVRKVPVDPGFGCPNRDGEISVDGCAFCNPESFVPERARSGSDPVAQIGEARKGRETEPFIAYMQAGTGTYADEAVLRDTVDALCGLPNAVGLFVGTRPDFVSEAVLKIFEPWLYRKLVWLEMGLQSASDKTLKLIHRGHDVASFTSARELARHFGIPVLAHVILGLPGENVDRMLQTARYLADLGVEGVKIHHLQVIKGTRMERMLAEKQVMPLNWETYPALVTAFLELLPPWMVIHRLLSDACGDTLIAPRWPARGVVLQAIRDHMIKGGYWQGRLYGRDLPLLSGTEKGRNNRTGEKDKG